MNKSFFQKLCLLFSDAASLGLSLVIAVFILNLLRPGAQEYIDFNKLGLAKLFGFAILVVFWQQEQYTKRRPFWEELKLIYQTVIIFAIIHFCFTYLVAHHIVKLVNIVFWLLLFIVLPCFRVVIKQILMYFNYWQRNVYIIGTKNNALNALKILTQDYFMGYRIIGFVTIEEMNTMQDLQDLPIYSFKTLMNPKNYQDAEICFALENHEIEHYIDKISILQPFYSFISVIPDHLDLPLYGAQLDHFFGSNQILLRLKNNLSRRLNRLIKRICDLLIASVALIIFCPFMIVFSLILLITSDKIFFKHKRLGLNGRYFNCLKFQTMHSNSSQILENLLNKDASIKLEWETTYKLKNDPRVTKFGKFLRKTSFDELPQLINVFMGEMSIVGPRPIIDKEIEKYAADIYYYNLVRPGITGLWQISGRNDIDYSNRVALDVWYVKNWSLWYDFVIILKTIIVVILRKGAY